jgi:hypothetical protein
LQNIINVKKYKMEKFLSIPVTNEQFQIVSATDIKLIEQASTTTVTITYGAGKVITITHATAGSGVETQRDAIEAAVVATLEEAWTKVTYEVMNLPFAVSGIAIA